MIFWKLFKFKSYTHLQMFLKAPTQEKKVDI